MKEKYFDCIEKVSQILFEAISTREENLKDKILEIDTDLLSLLRAIGWRVMSMSHVSNATHTPYLSIWLF